MNLLVAKWGNSLALRIPNELVRRIGIKEGDSVQATLAADGTLCLRAAAFDRKGFARELAAMHLSMPVSESVMDDLRQGARY